MILRGIKVVFYSVLSFFFVFFLCKNNNTSPICLSDHQYRHNTGIPQAPEGDGEKILGGYLKCPKSA